MSILEYLEACRESLNREAGAAPYNSELDKARGTTYRMHGYCCSHGLGDIPDLDIVWKPSKSRYIWRVKV